MTVQPYLGLRQVDLPKDESTRTPELKPAKVIKQAASAAPAVPTPVARLALDPTSVAPSMSMEVEVGGVLSHVPATAAPSIVTPAIATLAITTPAVTAPANDTPAIGTPAIDTPVIDTPAIDTLAIELQGHIQQDISATEGDVAPPVVEPIIEKRVEAALDNWSAPVAAAEELASTFTQPTVPVASPPPALTTASGAELSSSSMEIDNSPSDIAAGVVTSAPSVQEITVDVPVTIQVATAAEAPQQEAEAPQQEAAAAPITPIHVPAEEPVPNAAAVVASVQPVEPSTPVSLPGSNISSNMDVDSNVPSTEATPAITSEPSPVTQDAEMTPVTPAITAGDVTSASLAVVEPVSEQHQQQLQDQHQHQQAQTVDTISATESSLDQTETAPAPLSHPPSS